MSPGMSCVASSASRQLGAGAADATVTVRSLLLSADLGDDDWVLHPVSGLPVTTAARTIADLADEGHEPGYLLDLVADAAGASLVEKRELLEALTGKEEAFDLPAGDAAGLEDVLGEYFPAPELDGRMRAAIDEAVRPLREQIDTLMRSLAPRVTVGEEVAKMVAGTALPPGLQRRSRRRSQPGCGETFPSFPLPALRCPLVGRLQRAPPRKTRPQIPAGEAARRRHRK